MQCIVCKMGNVQPQKATAVFEINETTIIFKNVPALVCENCGEKYFDEETSEKLIEKAHKIAQSDVELDIRDYNKTAA